MVVYFSTYANPLYSTSDLRQIRYTTHPTYKHVVLQLLYGLVALGPLAYPSRSAEQRIQQSRDFNSKIFYIFNPLIEK